MEYCRICGIKTTTDISSWSYVNRNKLCNYCCPENEQDKNEINSALLTKFQKIFTT